LTASSFGSAAIHSSMTGRCLDVSLGGSRSTVIFILAVLVLGAAPPILAARVARSRA